jgi:YgiT-type zinc finger domain-containing protein
MGKSQTQEIGHMKCAVCGTELSYVETDLPFKVKDASIVILKGLPVLQCGSCPQYVLEDEVLRRVDEILVRVDSAAELEVIRFAA